MKKEKPAVINELSLNEFILVFKYFMRKTNCAHVTGFVNAPLLYAKPNETELEQLINLAIKHGTLVRNGNETTINGVVYTFINAWSQSSNIVTIKRRLIRIRREYLLPNWMECILLCCRMR